MWHCPCPRCRRTTPASWSVPATTACRKGDNSVVQCAQSADVAVVWKNTSYLSVISGDNPWIWGTDERFRGIVGNVWRKCVLSKHRFSRTLHLHKFTWAPTSHNAVILQMEEAHFSETTPWWNMFFRGSCFRCPTSTPEMSATFTSDIVRIVNWLGSTHHRVLARYVWSNRDTLRHSTV